MGSGLEAVGPIPGSDSETESGGFWGVDGQGVDAEVGQVNELFKPHGSASEVEGGRPHLEQIKAKAGGSSSGVFTRRQAC